MVDTTPSRFLQGQAAGSSLSEMRTLALDIFGGEVITAYHQALITAGKVQKRVLSGGMRSARFPKVWKATGEYHVAGKELLGNEIETGEISVTPDELLVAHTAIYDLDDMLSHFDVRSQFAQELGFALAAINDKNVFRSIVLAARTAADGPFPGGNVIIDATLLSSGAIDGAAWISAIRQANRALFLKNVPLTQPKFMAVNYDVFEAIKYAKDENGQYILINTQVRGNQGNGFADADETLKVDGVTIYKTVQLPSTNESADTSVYTKYRANYSTTTGLLWTPMAVANVTMRDIRLEHERTVRRQENFMVASSLSGNGALRPECAVEFKTS